MKFLSIKLTAKFVALYIANAAMWALLFFIGAKALVKDRMVTTLIIMGGLYIWSQVFSSIIEKLARERIGRRYHQDNAGGDR